MLLGEFSRLRNSALALADEVDLSDAVTFRSALDGDAGAAAQLSPVVDTLLTLLHVPERDAP